MRNRIAFVYAAFRVGLLAALVFVAVQLSRIVTQQAAAAKAGAALHAQMVGRQDEQTRLLRLICVNTVKAVKSAQMCVTPPLVGPVPQ